MFFYNSKLDKLVDSMFNDLNSTWSSTFTKYEGIPSIVRDEDGMELTLTLPGYERENLEVAIEDDTLTIETLKETLNDDQREFSKAYTILEDIDKSTCTTEMKAGILKIKFKTKEEKKPKKIIIK